MKVNQFQKILMMFLLSVFSVGCTEEESVVPEKSEPQKVEERGNSGLTGPVLKVHKNNYIIVSSTDELPSNLENRIVSMNGKVTHTINEIGIAVATSNDPQFESRCSKISGVKSVIKDYSAQWIDPPKERRSPSSLKVKNPPTSGDDDVLFDLQWGHDAINTPEAWKTGYRGAGVKVAILDTGFDLEHPDLLSNVDLSCSANFVPEETLQFDPDYLSSHGTFTAGIVAAPDNGVGIIGVAPKARLMLVKVLNDGGSGAFSWLLQGIVHAVNNGADVINMSLSITLRRDGKFVNDNGTEDPNDDFLDFDPEILEFIDALSKATKFAHKKGVTLIAAAGNDARNADADKNLLELPAQAPHVISISATTPKGWAKNPSTNLDLSTSYSNSGLSLVDLAAPGGDIWDSVTSDCTLAEFTLPCSYFDLIISTDYGGWSLASGTSGASPYAAGVAALIIGKHKGSIKPDEVIAILKASADDIGKSGRDACFGNGRVNAFRAVVEKSQMVAGKL